MLRCVSSLVSLCLLGIPQDPSLHHRLKERRVIFLFSLLYSYFLWGETLVVVIGILFLGGKFGEEDRAYGGFSQSAEAKHSNKSQSSDMSSAFYYYHLIDFANKEISSQTKLHLIQKLVQQSLRYWDR